MSFIARNGNTPKNRNVRPGMKGTQTVQGGVAMPQKFPDYVLEQEAATSDVILARPDDSFLADPRLEPPLTGSLDHDLRQVQQSLRACEERQRHFDHVVAGRLSGISRRSQNSNG